MGGSIQTVASIFLTQVLQPFLDGPEAETTSASPGITTDTRKFIWRYFGTTSRSLFTMFCITFGGWQGIVRTMIEDIGGYLILFWFPYIVVVAFTIMKIIGHFTDPEMRLRQ